MPNLLHRGDCIPWLATLPENVATVCVTDIPYEVVNRASGGLRKLTKGAADTKTFPLSEFLPAIVRVVSGSIYVFCSTEQVSEVRGGLVTLGLTTRLCIWEKTNPSPMNGERLWLSSVECCVFARKPKAVFNEHCQSPVFRFSVPRKTGHPTPKPIALCRRLIEASSLVGDTVIDPCMGGGNIGVAAIQSGRRFIGAELNPEYFQIAESLINNEEQQCLI